MDKFTLANDLAALFNYVRDDIQKKSVNKYQYTDLEIASALESVIMQARPDLPGLTHFTMWTKIELLRKHSPFIAAPVLETEGAI